MKFASFFFALSVVMTVFASNENCSENEHYQSCVGCAQTCAVYEFEKTIGHKLACSSNCHPGCVCNDGYIKSEWSLEGGFCILKKDCPKTGDFMESIFSEPGSTKPQYRDHGRVPES